MTMYRMMHGVNPRPGTLLMALGLTEANVPRFRNAYLGTYKNTPASAIYTRMGGGCRRHWDGEETPEGPECDCPGCRAEHVLAGHRNYLGDADDEFDNTYATYWFAAPQARVDAAIGAVDATPEERMRAIINALEKPDDATHHAATAHVRKTLTPLAEAIASKANEGLTVDGDGSATHTPWESTHGSKAGEN